MQQASSTLKPTNETLDSLQEQLQSISVDDVAGIFDLTGCEELLKSTISVCPDCLNHAMAVVYVDDGRVWKNTLCNVHGVSKAVLEQNAAFYRVTNKDKWGVRYTEDRQFDIPAYSKCCGTSCGAKAPSDRGAVDYQQQLGNKSCTVLLEVTNACNLACRVCYADARGDRILAFEEVKAHIQQLTDAKGFIDSVQVTGGEATIHPNFWDIVDWLFHQQSIGKIYLPTNGIEFSKPEIVQKLKMYRSKILVLLQFDGGLPNANKAMRRADTQRVRQKVIKNLDRIGVCMQLTMAVTHQLNESEISWVVEQGLKHRHIRLVGILPAFYTGRFELPTDPVERPTLSTVVLAIGDALAKHVGKEDFVPIPCSHPNCGWTSLFARRFGLLFNITQKINLEEVMNEVAYKTILDKREIRSVLGDGGRALVGRVLTWVGRRLVRPKDVFGIAIKPFMDRFNYDADRVANCCHQILDTKGNLISFCEYNTRLRASDTWASKPQLDGRHKAVAKAVERSFDD